MQHVAQGASVVDVTGTAVGGRRFRLVLIKPSHYDDDGYVIQCYRRIKRDPQRMAYMDLAVQRPVTDDEVATRELFQSEAAQTFIIKVEKREKLRRGELA